MTLGANDVVLGHAHRLSRNLVDLAGRKPLVLRVLRHSIDRYAGSDVQTGERTATGEGMRAPAWVIGVLVGLATVVAIWSGLNIWLDGQVLNTDQWTESSVELLENDEVRGALSVFLVNEVYERVDVAGELADRLPDDLDGLAAPLAGLLRGTAVEGVDIILGTSASNAAWREANRTAHETLVVTIRDGGDDTTVLELGSLVGAAGSQLGLAEETIALFPDEAGQVVLIQSDSLGLVRQTVKVVDLLATWLLVLSLLLYGLAIWLAGPEWRRTVVYSGVGLVLAGLVLIIVRRVAVAFVVSKVGDVTLKSAAQAVAEIGTTVLAQVSLAMLINGLVLVLFASLVGPSSRARRIRDAIAPLFLASPWILWGVVAIVFVGLLAFTPNAVFQSWFTVLIAAVAVVIGVEVVRRQVASDGGGHMAPG